MKIDKGIYLTFTLAGVCLLLTVIAISAKAEEQLPPQPQPIISEVATRPASHPARDVISRQLDAIHARNAEIIWSLASEDMQEKFGTPEGYLAHLRFKLRPVYNHEDYRFIGASDGEASLIQRVEMDNRYGDPVTVIYRLEQKDGAWRIDSLAILPQDDAEPI